MQNRIAKSELSCDSSKQLTKQKVIGRPIKIYIVYVFEAL